MRGTRPLTTEEILKVSKQFKGTFETRNRCMFKIGVNVGGRISELLSLQIGDVWQNNKAVSDLLFTKGMVKGKETSRMIPVNNDCREAIAELIKWHKEQCRDLNTRRPLFTSRKTGKGQLKALSRTQAHRILVEAFRGAGLNGKLATHSMRKTFAQNIYDNTGDLALCQELLGHLNISTTRQYVSVSYDKCKRAVESIELNRTHILLHSIDELSDNDLIVELAKRGYDTSSIIDQLRVERVTSKVTGKIRRDHKAKVVQTGIITKFLRQKN